MGDWAIRRAAPLISALLLAVAVVACSGEDADPVALRLADLVRFADGYDGKRIATTGVVRSHPDPEHYWIEDGELNRVEVRPASAVSALFGKSVRVVGRFRYSLEQGRSIEAESVEAIAE